ncbi:hypothetical protein IQ241_07020 [Romeria aff. gracilis LEGE 07310]|uniref:Uncharacterized protein n=1 Tax=Vasconcelosia minhoensis LEGE 07310 TaxID=915328 RepID=A0A8J7A6S0_9CYAN|nr:hypothetical protein [Romeria gracilis]MBE9077050.1 hypothetical protein [Romeria aff. gracilis LEGE 07310]
MTAIAAQTQQLETRLGSAEQTLGSIQQTVSERLAADGAARADWNLDLPEAGTISAVEPDGPPDGPPDWPNDHESTQPVEPMEKSGSLQALERAL